MLDIFVVLFFAHLVTDFVLQTDKMVVQKNSKNKKIRIRAIFKHSLVFFWLCIGLCLLTSTLEYITTTGIFVLTMSHFVVDWLKISLTGKYSKLKLFVIDQLIHIIFIVLSIIYFGQDTQNVFIQIIETSEVGELLNIRDKVFIILSAMIIITTFANLFIRTALMSIRMKIVDDVEVVKIGRYIGCVERILTVFAVMAGAYQALAALYASKAAIRFGQVREDPQFGEYFILGTSISAIIAISVGYILKRVFAM